MSPPRSPNKPEISPTKKGELYGKYTQGVSMGDLSKEYDRSKSTIQGIIEHREDTGTCRPTRRPGNSPILDADAEDRLVRHVRRDPKQKSSQIADSAGVSASTVERIMKKHGHIRARCRQKPILSAKNIRDRLAWAVRNVRLDSSHIH
jgi:hypothetical protein